ncbi:MAG TPA: beta-glucosidase BglX [Bryobacteraceae bacterium]|jgi:beta-glucosidase|nr:beta-glucosidase BglX [Bryobacteraceae bacterium]
MAAASAMQAATPAEIEKKIDALVARMTLEEKLGQMSQSLFGDLNDKEKEEIRQGRWGSLYGGGTPAQKIEAQRIALKESRLGIPLIFGEDVIHGKTTTFPIPLGQAASWDPELVRQAARVAARETSAVGTHWTFSPMMDIARDPRWGRISEGFGEDPVLASRMAAAMVRGYQGDALDAPDSIAACAKHYVGYGAAEGGRDYNSTWIPEDLLRDVYLAPFQAAQQAGVATVMSAFNDLNGVPSSANAFTMRQVLRDEWKFDGFVVSDYTSVAELIPHGYAADGADAALKAIRGGVDMEMVSTEYWDHGKALVASRQLDPKLLDEAVRDILRIKFRLGLFDAKGLQTPVAAAPPTAAALETARKLAAESLVLLKNENGALPLRNPPGTVAVIGPLADSPRDQLGSWASGPADTAITPLTALRETLGAEKVVYVPGLKTSRDESHDGFAQAVALARRSDVVLLFLGEEASLSGEAASRAYLDLPGAQEALVNEIAQTGKPLIAIILAGRPLTFHDAAAKCRAVLYAWHPGTMGGPAIADILLGKMAPTGRLPVTFPRTVGQVPIYYDHMDTGRPPSLTGPAAEDKYRSKYLDVSFTPEYPFGFGLSYTAFAYSDLHVSAPTVPIGGSLTVSAEVANAGKVEADETVQFYIRQLAASRTQPVRELKDFRRVHLRPGEKQRVEFTLKSGELAFHKGAQLVTEPGQFQVWIAPDSSGGLGGQFELVH